MITPHRFSATLALSLLLALRLDAADRNVGVGAKAPAGADAIVPPGLFLAR